MSWFTAASTGREGFDLTRLIRRLVVLVFALIQAILVARILLDLGVIPVDSGIGELIVTYSEMLAAPVQGVGNGFGSMFGGDGIESIAGQGFDGVMVVALLGWSVVEGLVMRVVRKLDAV